MREILGLDPCSAASATAIEAAIPRPGQPSLADSTAPRSDRKPSDDDPIRQQTAVAGLSGLGGSPDTVHEQPKRRCRRVSKSISFRESTSPEPEGDSSSGEGGSPAAASRGKRGYYVSRRQLAHEMGCDFSDGPEIRRRRAFVKKLCEEAGHPLTRALTQFGQPVMMQIIDTVHAAVNDDERGWGWSKDVTKAVLMAVAADNVSDLKKNRKGYKKRTGPSAPYKFHKKLPKTLRAIGSSSSGADTIAAAAAAHAAATAPAGAPATAPAAAPATAPAPAPATAPVPAPTTAPATAAAAATSTASTTGAHPTNRPATTPINPPVSPISGENALSSKALGASGQPQRTPLGEANNCNSSSA